MPHDPAPQSQVLPILVLAAIVAVLLGGYLGFPRFQAWMAQNDCVASGRTAC